ncbi:MAG TPA: hypothetical protein VMX13_10175 [Sedimentisphaerales bacterium]|nr:hypothetical protein [Sedimentisphaerales bacterium]
MAEHETEHQQAQTTRRGPRLRWWIGMAMLAAAALLALLWLSNRLTLRRVDERLAAIEAARAIPDTENAAVIYNRLMKDYGKTQVPWGVVNVNTDTTPDKPWLSEDNPQLRMWLREQQPLIAGLLQASTKKQCRFPITGYPHNIPQRGARSVAMRSWAFLLLRAGNNDVAEGRIEPAVRKYLAAITMGVHHAQQPVVEDNIIGLCIESWPLNRTRTFVAEGPFAETDFKAIEAALPPIRNEWDNFSPQTAQVDRLYRRKQRVNLLESVLRLFGRKPDTPDLEALHYVYLRTLASRRAMFILIALRRCKDKTGQWPSTLDEIRGLLPAEALIDPLSGGEFVYRLTEDAFTLYSTGRNRIDENGEYGGTKKGRPDDLQIWPPWSRIFQQRKAAEKQSAKPND